MGLRVVGFSNDQRLVVAMVRDFSGFGRKKESLVKGFRERRTAAVVVASVGV